MRFNNRQLLLILTSILISFSAIMMLSFIQMLVVLWVPDTYPFWMSDNHIIMKRGSEQRVYFDDIIDVDKDTGVLVISRDENSETIGVYDPNMIRAFENTSWVTGINRYFSYDDYVNKTKAGILISHACNREYTSDNISEVMYCSNFNSPFNYDGSTKEVVNLASLDSLGEYVYLDYGDEQAANRIIEHLRDSGYRRHNALEYVGLLKALFSSSKNLYGDAMTVGLLIYVFFGIASYWHFYNDRKNISIHFLYGGTLKKMASNHVGKFITLSLVGVIPALIFCFFLRRTSYFVMTDFTLMTFLATHVLITSLMYLLAFCLVFMMIRKSERGDNYVR